MKKIIFFSDGSAWPNPRVCLEENISEADKNRIVEAYSYLMNEMTIKGAMNRIRAIKKHLKEN